MQTHRCIPWVLWLLTLSACAADPISASDAALSPAPISTAGGAGGAGGATATPPAVVGGTVSTGGTLSATGGSAAATPSAAGSAPPVPTMVPSYTPEKFCGMIRVDEGGAIVMAGCEKNVRVIYELNREQIDNGAWHSTDYGIEAPCNDKGTFRAQVSGAVYDAANHLQSYYFLIHEQGGYEFAGTVALGFDATKVTAASGNVQGNACTFSVCAAADCGVLDTTMLSTVRGDDGAAGGAPTPAGGSGAGGSSSATPGLGGRGGAGGRTSGGSGGRATGGSVFGFSPPPP